MPPNRPPNTPRRPVLVQARSSAPKRSRSALTIAAAHLRGLLVGERPLGRLEGEVDRDRLAPLADLLAAVDVEDACLAKDRPGRLARRIDERADLDVLVDGDRDVLVHCRVVITSSYSTASRAPAASVSRSSSNAPQVPSSSAGCSSPTTPASICAALPGWNRRCCVRVHGARRGASGAAPRPRPSSAGNRPRRRRDAKPLLGQLVLVAREVHACDLEQRDRARCRLRRFAAPPRRATAGAPCASPPAPREIGSSRRSAPRSASSLDERGRVDLREAERRRACPRPAGAIAAACSAGRASPAARAA